MVVFKTAKTLDYSSIYRMFMTHPKKVRGPENLLWTFDSIAITSEYSEY